MINIYTQDGQQSWQLLYNLNLFRKWKTYIRSSTVTPRLKIFKQAEQWHHLLILTLIQTLYKTLTRTVYSEGKKLRREVMKKIFKHLRRLFILLSHHDVLNLNLCSLVNPSNAQIDAKTLCIDWSNFRSKSSFMIVTLSPATGVKSWYVYAARLQNTPSYQNNRRNLPRCPVGSLLILN